MKKQGFTLIEIIITISLIVVISNISINYSKIFYKTSDYEIERFVSDINYVKSLSLQGDRTAKITLDYDGYTVYSKNLSYSIGFSDTIRISGVSVKTIQFTPSLWTNGTTINIKVVDKPYRLTISAITGRVKLEK